MRSAGIRWAMQPEKKTRFSPLTDGAGQAPYWWGFFIQSYLNLLQYCENIIIAREWKKEGRLHPGSHFILHRNKKYHFSHFTGGSQVLGHVRFQGVQLSHLILVTQLRTLIRKSDQLSTGSWESEEKRQQLSGLFKHIQCASAIPT